MQNSNTKRVKLWAAIAFVAVVIVIAASVLWFPYGDGNTEPKREAKPHVTVGIQVSPAMALVMVAKDKGFFGQEQIDVELKEFTAGKFALQAFLSGSIDFAVSGEVPVALASLQGNQMRVVTQVVGSTIERCINRITW